MFSLTRGPHALEIELLPQGAPIDAVVVQGVRIQGYAAQVTNVGLKLPVSQRETPQSVSVLTRSRRLDVTQLAFPRPSARLRLGGPGNCG